MILCAAHGFVRSVSSSESETIRESYIIYTRYPVYGLRYSTVPMLCGILFALERLLTIWIVVQSRVYEAGRHYIYIYISIRRRRTDSTTTSRSPGHSWSALTESFEKLLLLFFCFYARVRVQTSDHMSNLRARERIKTSIINSLIEFKIQTYIIML